MFETDRLPSGWDDRINALDYVLVPSAFAEKTFISGGVNPSKVIVWGEGVDTVFFDPRRLPPPARSNEVFSFLSVFKFEERKNWKLLIESFLDEFAGDASVKLTILTSAYHQSESTTPLAILDSFIDDYFLEKKIRRPQRNTIFLVSDLSPHQLYQLYQVSDAFVLPTRGEGWGRPIVEAMSMEIPVIVTNWGGSSKWRARWGQTPP